MLSCLYVFSCLMSCYMYAKTNNDMECWSHSGCRLRHHVTKLDPKDLKCVFLRYSCIQKNYLCYSPSLKRYMVFIDMCSLEHIIFPLLTPLPLRRRKNNRLYIRPFLRVQNNIRKFCLVLSSPLKMYLLMFFLLK